mgnify:CR=1 FL=1
MNCHFYLITCLFKYIIRKSRNRCTLKVLVASWFFWQIGQCQCKWSLSLNALMQSYKESESLFSVDSVNLEKHKNFINAIVKTLTILKVKVKLSFSGHGGQLRTVLTKLNISIFWEFRFLKDLFLWNEIFMMVKRDHMKTQHKH